MERLIHAIVKVQFGGLAQLDWATNNYKDNLNLLYRHPDLMLTVDNVLCNIIMSTYSHYIDSWPMNGACVGHHAILMRSMLQFACIMASIGAANGTSTNTARGRATTQQH